MTATEGGSAHAGSANGQRAHQVERVAGLVVAALNPCSTSGFLSARAGKIAMPSLA
jgi:hypothetical protein